MLLDAPLAIQVSSDRKLEKHRASWIQDCSAATQNILLAAHSLGLGSVWLGIFPKAERVAGMQKLLNLPGDIRPFGLVAIGYPVVEPEPVDRYKKERVHRNQW